MGVNKRGGPSSGRLLQLLTFQKKILGGKGGRLGLVNQPDSISQQESKGPCRQHTKKVIEVGDLVQTL